MISWVGNGAMFIALPVYVYTETNSTLATALSVMANALATIVIGQVAGVFVDRWNHRRTLLWGNLVLAALTLVFLTVLHAPWWLILPVAFVQSAAGQFLGPAENALLPTLVTEQDLAAANSLNALNNNLARLLGPALGGLLIASIGFAGVVVDALTYLLAAGLVFLVRASQVSHEQPREGQAAGRFWQEWRAGLRAVRRNPLLTLGFVIGALVGLGKGSSPP
nr:MFS transporter [Deinococcus budaensis]